MPPRLHVVLLRSGDAARGAEGLRCAVGLTLGGARVRVLFAGEGLRLIRLALAGERAFARPLALLAAQGHELYSEEGGPEHEEIEPLPPGPFRQKLLEGETSAAW
jgi:hypothetical protein